MEDTKQNSSNNRTTNLSDYHCVFGQNQFDRLILKQHVSHASLKGRVLKSLLDFDYLPPEVIHFLIVWKLLL